MLPEIEPVPDTASQHDDTILKSTGSHRKRQHGAAAPRVPGRDLPTADLGAVVTNPVIDRVVLAPRIDRVVLAPRGPGVAAAHLADAPTRLGDCHAAAGDHQSAERAWQHAVAILDDLRHPGADEVRRRLVPTR